MLWGYAAGKGTHPALQRQVLAGHIPLWLMCSYILAALILLDVLSLVSCNLISCRVPVFWGEFHLGLIWEEGEMSSQHPSKAGVSCPSFESNQTPNQTGAVRHTENNGPMSSNVPIKPMLWQEGKKWQCLF